LWGTWIASADLNLDGATDIVYVSGRAYQNDVCYLRCDVNSAAEPGNFLYAFLASIPGGGPYGLAVEDMDADGDPDIILARSDEGMVQFFENMLIDLNESPCHTSYVYPTLVQGEEEFGHVVELEGEVAFIGAPRANNSQGKVYICRYDGLLAGWDIEAELTASDGQSGDEFGFSLDVDGDLLVIGAPSRNEAGAESGATYAFRKNDETGIWEEFQKLTPNDHDANDEFGYSVALDGTTCAVLSFGDMIEYGPPFGSAYGTVHVFDFESNHWEQTETLIPDPPTFGVDSIQGAASAITIDGNEVLTVGSVFLDEGPGGELLAIFSYRRNPLGEWSMHQRLDVAELRSTREAPVRTSWSGTTIVLDGTTAVVGVCTPPQSSGIAYVLQDTAGFWNHSTTLQSNASSTDDWFGMAVDVNDGLIAVSAPGGHDDDIAGVVYLYHKPDSSWELRGQLSSTRMYGDLFGSDVSMDGDRILIGDSWFDHEQPRVGSVFFYEGLQQYDCNGNTVPDICELFYAYAQDCNGNLVPDACDIQAGSSQDCNGDEIPDECQIDHVWIATSAPMQPLESSIVHQFSIPGPILPPGDVTITARGIGDLDAPTEYLEVFLNGYLIGRLFATTGFDCGPSPSEDQVVLPREDFEDLVGLDDAYIEIVASVAVSATECPTSAITIELGAFAPTVVDCNASGTPDLCDIILGNVADCNGNLIPDECEVPSPCPWDSTGDCEIAVEDFFDLLQHWGPCPNRPTTECPWDTTGETGIPDGIVDTADFFTLLQNWGPCE
jgi:hypothetical protein